MMKSTFDNNSGDQVQRDPLWFTHVGYKYSKDGKLEPVDPEAATAFARYAAEVQEAMRRRSNEPA